MLVGAHYCRREGQDTQDELERRDLKEELEERERRHFSSKDKGYGGNFFSSSLGDFHMRLASH